MLLFLILPAYAQTTVPRDAKFEASWTLPNQTGNPYDPAQNDVQVAFHTPGGQAVYVPAFWDGDCWRVRFAPTQTGRYQLTVFRDGRAARPLGLTATGFRCVASASPGFVRRDPAHAQRFIFDDGLPYYPFGLNQAWSSPGLPGYPATFERMHDSGLNWARVWMTFWDGKALEWTPERADSPPLGQFSLDAARRWDALFDAAEKNGIYIQMCLQHHGQYTERTDPNWRDNPYNAANGGFLTRPQDFFTDPQARRLTRAKYRYIVARWGYSTHLMAFELFNEVQNIGEARPYFGNVVAWHREMAACLRALDVNHHLITTSNSPPDDPLAKIGLDFDQIHVYTPDVLSALGGLDVPHLAVPVFLGEWGASGTQSAAFLHDGLWAGLMRPTAGAPQFWYWDQVQKQNWWPQFGSVSRFLQASQMTRHPGLKALPVRVISSSTRADLSFAPPGGWGINTTRDVVVWPDGALNGLSGLSAFIQGQYHREMTPRPINFHLQCTAPCRFEMRIGRVARAGARPQLLMDGKVVGEKDDPAGDADRDVAETLTSDVPAGPHTVSVFNTGADWFVVDGFVVTDYAPALAVFAKGDSRAAFFWACNRDRSGAAPTFGNFALLGLAPGRYSVLLWDTSTGRPIGVPAALTVGGTPAAITLPSFARDVAGYVTRS